MYQTGGTIKETIDLVQRHEYVLPAIQREFVWKPEQIQRLFDSLMQGYPFGTFLLWRVQPENSSKYRFYDFVREYHEKDNPHCPQLPLQHNKNVTAVLDGQQRLTALNIGLCGSMAVKQPQQVVEQPRGVPDAAPLSGPAGGPPTPTKRATSTALISSPTSKWPRRTRRIPAGSRSATS